MSTEKVYGLYDAELAAAVHCRTRCPEWRGGRDCECAGCSLYRWSPGARLEPDLAWFVVEERRRAKRARERAAKR